MSTVSCHVAGKLPDGRTVHRWRLVSGTVTADILTLGASLHALHCLDRAGRSANVVLTPQSLADKLTTARYFGAVVGRYANRIADGLLPGPHGPRQLSRNENGHTLHGGTEGFDTRIWQARPLGGGGPRCGVELSLPSPDGDQGFPGNLQAAVTYTLDGGDLRIDYYATADAVTPVSLTNHAYWNLAGAGGTVLDHDLQVSGDHYTPVDSRLIPLPGAPHHVAGTPFDLTAPRRLKEVLEAPGNDQLSLAGGGPDHNWVLSTRGSQPEAAAVLTHGATGRRLRVLTTEPGLQVYTANHFDATVSDSGGTPFPRHGGIALETQHFPNSPRRPDYPSPWVGPDRPYRSATVYRFDAQGA